MINTGYISGHGSLRINTLTNEGHIGVGQGDLSLSGSLVHNGTIGVEDGRTLTIFGGLSGGGTTSGTGTVVVYGTVSPGSSPGRLTFGGDLILSGDKLLMELSGLTPGTQADQLVVLGEITVGNVLEVDCIDGWQPAAGDYYRLLEFGSISGAFSEVRLPELEGGLSWDTSDLYSTGAIAVIPEPATLALLALGGLALIGRRRVA